MFGNYSNFLTYTARDIMLPNDRIRKLSIGTVPDEVYSRHYQCYVINNLRELSLVFEREALVQKDVHRERLKLCMKCKEWIIFDSYSDHTYAKKAACQEALMLSA